MQIVHQQSNVSATKQAFNEEHFMLERRGPETGTLVGLDLLAGF